MAGRSDELKGGLKEGLGKLTGDEALETEGRAQKQGGRARRKVSGAVTETKGNFKQVIGNTLDSPTLEAEGQADRRRGRAERA